MTSSAERTINKQEVGFQADVSRRIPNFLNLTKSFWPFLFLSSSVKGIDAVQYLLLIRSGYINKFFIIE